MSETQRRRLGKWIKRWRQEQSLSQKELALALGVTWITIMRWEQGATEPDVRSRRGWLDLLGKPLHEAAGVAPNWKAA